VPLTRRDTPGGPVWVRPRYRPEDYTAPPDAVQLFLRWRGDAYPSEAILTMRDGPFGNYVEVGREERSGATWLVLLEASREFALEVERSVTGFGEIVPVPPERAYALAVARDALRSRPVVQDS
jgi:hypothetical protein